MTEKQSELFLRLETNVEHCLQEDLRDELKRNIFDLKEAVGAQE